jgi:hypothetical protein
LTGWRWFGAGEGARKQFPPLSARNPLESLNSDERKQGKERKGGGKGGVRDKNLGRLNPYRRLRSRVGHEVRFERSGNGDLEAANADHFTLARGHKERQFGVGLAFLGRISGSPATE